MMEVSLYGMSNAATKSARIVTSLSAVDAQGHRGWVSVLELEDGSALLVPGGVWCSATGADRMARAYAADRGFTVKA